MSTLEAEMKMIHDRNQKVTLIEENLISTNSNVSSLKTRLDELERSIEKVKPQKSSGNVDKKLVEMENKERNLQ